jgi:hypothetical protein
MRLLRFPPRRRLAAILLVALVLAPLAVLACRRVVYDIMTSERLVRVPHSSKSTFEIDTHIEIPETLGEDKTVDSATLDLVASNMNTENPVSVDITIADEDEPGNFRPIIAFELAAGETRTFQVVQTEPEDALVHATQTKELILRFESVSPSPGIGEIEFRFTVRVLAHKETPGTGPGTLLFY